MSVGFILLRPYWLLALLPAAWAWWRCRRRDDARGMWAEHIAPHLLDHLMVTSGDGARVRPIHLLGVLWLAFVLALCGPAWRPVPSPFAGDEAGVVVVLKMTPSMTATDVGPSRLARALQKLRDFLEARAGAPTGLIVYSGTSHLVMPLTRDAGVLLLMTEGMEPGMMPVAGDCVAVALKQGSEMLARTPLGGTVLLMADSATVEDAATVTALESLGVPVQILAINASGSIDPTLEKLARATHSRVVGLSVDESDVVEIARRAAGRLGTQSASADSGTQLEDDGYWLVPLIGLIVLVWSRKGWSLR